MSPSDLARCWDITEDRATPFASGLTEAMERFHIDTPQRQAMFLAQCGHESGCGKWLRELWGPTTQQKRYDPPSDLAKQLGNVAPGDGRRYLGRGFIQTTGLANYRALTKGLGQIVPVPDFERSPELLEQPIWAALSAGWFWDSHHLNQYADIDDIETCTKRINGGLTGLDDRKALWQSAKLVLT